MDENNESIESRLSRLEADVSFLKSQSVKDRTNWIEVIADTRKEDRDFYEIVRLGKELRDAEKHDFYATELAADTSQAKEGIAAAGCGASQRTTRVELLRRIGRFLAAGTGAV